MATTVRGGIYIPEEDQEAMAFVPEDDEDELTLRGEHELFYELGMEGDGHGFFCAHCDSEIEIDADIALVQYVMPYINGAEITYVTLSNDEGEPVVPPLYFGFSCWENMGQDIAEMVADEPPLEEEWAALSCDYCRCSIRMGEKCCTVTLGEIAQSQRAKDTTTFVPTDGGPYVMCLVCATRMVDLLQRDDEWTDISQNGECYFCTKARCWRVGRCMCNCHCHK